MGRKLGRQMAKLAKRAAPLVSAIAPVANLAVPGSGAVLAAGGSILANSAKTNRAGHAKFNFGSVLKGTLQTATQGPGVPGLGFLKGLGGGKPPSTPSGARLRSDAGAEERGQVNAAASGQGQKVGLFGRMFGRK